MPRYVALLRGVSPSNCRMPQLRECLRAAGFDDVRTLLSSGNAVFGTRESPWPALERQAEQAMLTSLGRAFPTIIRPVEHLRGIVASDPFAGFDLPPTARRVVTFLRRPDALDRKLPIERDGARILRVTATEVFTAYEPGPRGPVFMTLLERTFGKDITTRTLDTVRSARPRSGTGHGAARPPAPIAHPEPMIRSLVYDTLILGLTTRWYAEVLRRVPHGAALLDVGIGTAGALLANADVVRGKDLRVVGVDVDADYVECARQRLGDSAIADRAEVRLESVHDHHGGPYDVVYFSGSFMLLPEPERALRHCGSLLAPGGRIFFTQTIQTRRARWMETLKPLLKRVTSIDFGRVTYEDDFRAQLRAAGLELEEFTVLVRHGSRASCLAVAWRAGAGSQPRETSRPLGRR